MGYFLVVSVFAFLVSWDFRNKRWKKGLLEHQTSPLQVEEKNPLNEDGDFKYEIFLKCSTLTVCSQ